ncbi:MAG: hypothetical protein A3I24_03695 [Candidatus Harrisonbacteria bacterium RIFCSPLOWO2_02_FULL_41_13b]|uniref:Membrane insertase YidC/Oxa/ALB C-terminal domain-containing protein n=1 Tax=Candidatus Harrisonbacteria bacterium RIFCSPLOWO2_02_FULL_41_13b TaxID=1798409 RepID=A0A1G1ZTV5_9BACT|nr:MAG: hypothetical protein A3I24_03695 [Candidatus Harrisonbacteria bacterium RIFCSPLOWO2_02_FULL_41_13b]
MSSLFHTFLFNPLFNALIFLYNLVGDIGVAIILLTIAVRLIFYPLFYKSFKNQTIMNRLQPEIQKIQHDHKNDKEKQAQALMGLYRQHKVNPFSGFLLIFIQLPVLIALYRVFLSDFSPESLSGLYNFVAKPEIFNGMLLGLIDLKTKSIFMVVLSAIAQYFQGKLSLSKRDPQQEESSAAKIGRQMVYIGPALTVIVLFSLPSAIALYWLVGTIFSIIQQLIINRKLKNKNQESNL